MGQVCQVGGAIIYLAPCKAAKAVKGVMQKKGTNALLSTAKYIAPRAKFHFKMSKKGFKE